MTYDAVISHVKKQVGLNPETLGAAAVEAVVAARMRATGIADATAYAHRIAADARELQELIDALVVSETWFFRGADAIDLVAAHVRDLATGRPAGRPVRILSLACSTGEEPYSVVMALHRGGVPSAAFAMVAVDLSARNLSFARAGLYGDFSFRQTGADSKALFFRPMAESWEIHSSIRASVTFRSGNLVDPRLLADETPFDVVFCRNVLIYFTPAARRLALANIERLLVPGGLLALGHAESSELLDPPWRRFGTEGACVFQFVGDTKAEETLPTIVASINSRDFAGRPSTAPEQRPTKLENGPSRRPLPIAGEDRTNRSAGKRSDCWNEIGVRGDRSCPELDVVGHCHNCPVFAAAGRRCLDNPSPEGYLEEWTARLAEPVEDSGAGGGTTLLFRLAEEWLALPVQSVVEVTMPRPVHRVPHRGGLLDGVLNIRGELHLCVRVGELLGLAAAGASRSGDSGKSRLVVIGKGADCWAFLADEVDRVRRYRARELSPVPVTVGRAANRFTRGVLTANSKSVGLLDAARLFEAIRAKVR